MGTGTPDVVIPVSDCHTTIHVLKEGYAGSGFFFSDLLVVSLGRFIFC